MVEERYPLHERTCTQYMVADHDHYCHSHHQYVLINILMMRLKLLPCFFSLSKGTRRKSKSTKLCPLLGNPCSMDHPKDQPLCLGETGLPSVDFSGSCKGW